MDAKGLDWLRDSDRGDSRRLFQLRSTHEMIVDAVSLHRAH